MTVSHEAPLDILRKQPGVLLELLRLAGDPIADEPLRAELGASSLTEANPSVLNADLVSVIRDDHGAKRRVVVVEVQRARRDDKFASWAQYLAYLSAHEEAPVTLLVIALDRAVAEWARTPRSLGPSLAVMPLVIGPDDLPDLRAGWTTNLPLAIMTVVARNESPSPGARGEGERQEVLRVFEHVAGLEGEPLRDFYLNLTHGTARPEFRGTLEQVLEVYGMSALQLIFNEGKAEGEAKGKAEGKADTLLMFLRRRGFEVDEAIERRVHSTNDIAQLDAWLARVLDAEQLEDVFR